MDHEEFVSRIKLRMLRKIKRMQCPSTEFLEYIQIYQRIFRNALNEAKRNESDMFWQPKMEAKLYGNL
jgi:hypothetical protein